MKVCNKCKENDRYKNNTYCKACMRIYDSASRFKISFEYAKYLRNKIECDICTLPFKNNKDQHIDHCHSTLEVRGVLCRSCNHMLGNSKDNIQILKNGIKYLKKQLYYEQ